MQPFCPEAVLLRLSNNRTCQIFSACLLSRHQWNPWSLPSLLKVLSCESFTEHILSQDLLPESSMSFPAQTIFLLIY